MFLCSSGSAPTRSSSSRSLSMRFCCTYSGLLLAQSGHRPLHCTRPLLRVKRTSRFALHVSAFDPKRTWHRSWTLIQYQGLARTVIAATCDTAFCFCGSYYLSKVSRVSRMDFIERYLGISPDGGDGSLEVMVLVLLVLIVAAIGMHLSHWRKNQKNDKQQRRY